MILSDREIKAALARGALKLTPEPRSEAWSSKAVVDGGEKAERPAAGFRSAVVVG